MRKQILSPAELEDELSKPSEADVALLKTLDGDILILGAGGKIGPSLAKLAKRAADSAGRPRRIMAVSRFGSATARGELESAGVVTIACDLLDPAQVASLPRCENVLYLAGRKFGSSGRPDLTWAMNAIAPSLAARHFSNSRIVVYSTGNVYAFQSVSRDTWGRGSDESDLPAPVGEYAQSCLARERIFEYYSREFGTRCLLFRLNYATDLRYGVLVDIATKVMAGETVPLIVPAFNILWQGDANSYALRSLPLCASPPAILNVTGPETVSVRQVAEYFGRQFQREPRFGETEGTLALLNDASRCYSLLGPPAVRLETLLQWVADWIGAGREALDKPTHFEVADGRF
jgi:nucleoside-diphosphate-sugar epimerase